MQHYCATCFETQVDNLNRQNNRHLSLAYIKDNVYLCQILTKQHCIYDS
jgi:hypothetical protein